MKLTFQLLSVKTMNYPQLFFTSYSRGSQCNVLLPDMYQLPLFSLTRFTNIRETLLNYVK